MVIRIPMHGMDSPFKVIIDNQSKRKNEERKKTRTALYASDVFQCQRKVFMQFFPERFVQEAIDARTARIFANGEDVHLRLGAYFHADDQVEFKDEVSVPRGEIDVHGRCDGLANLQGQLYVLEFKSINKPTVDEPKEEHVGQLMYYLHMFEQKRGEIRKEFGLSPAEIVDESNTEGLEGATGRKVEDLDDVERMLLLSPGQLRGELIYESKATQSVFHFPIEYDSLKAEKALLWFRQMQGHLEAGVLPAIVYAKDKFPCSWKSRGGGEGKCQFFEYCHGVKKAEVEHISLVKFGSDNVQQSCAKNLNSSAGSDTTDFHGTP